MFEFVLFLLYKFAHVLDIPRKIRIVVFYLLGKLKKKKFNEYATIIGLNVRLLNIMNISAKFTSICKMLTLNLRTDHSLKVREGKGGGIELL